MPPALPIDADQESDEISIGSDIPARTRAESEVSEGQQMNGKPQGVDDESKANSNDEDSEAEEDVYEVEAIRSHRFLRGKILLSVKWKGYPEDQNTEESEEMLEEGASEILQNYYEGVGGRPEPPAKLGKRKSTSQLKAASDSPALKKSRRVNGEGENDTPGKVDKTGTWVPKKENWENEIDSIHTVERDGETGKLWAYINFTNDKRSKVGMELAHRHCPLAMLNFYENHLSVLSIPLSRFLVPMYFHVFGTIRFLPSLTCLRGL